MKSRFQIYRKVFWFRAVHRVTFTEVHQDGNDEFKILQTLHGGPNGLHHPQTVGFQVRIILQLLRGEVQLAKRKQLSDGWIFIKEPLVF